MAKTPSVNITLSSKQLSILYRKGYRYYVLYGGRGSGKSWGIAEFLIVEALANVGMVILCCRDLSKSVGPSSFKALTGTMKRLGVYHLFTITRDKILCITTGTEFIFTGLRTNSEDNLKSLEAVDIAWIEEGAKVGFKSWEDLVPSIRKPNSKIILSFNPSSPTDHVSQLFLSEKELPPKTIIRKINYYDNKYFKDTALVQEVEHMKATDYVRYLHIYEGQFEAVGDCKMFPYELIQASIGVDYKYEESVKIGALDVARFGDDRSVLMIREGNIVNNPKSWKGLDLVTLCDNVANEIIIHGIKKLVIDGVGVGAGVVDILKNKINNVCEIVEFNGAYKADDIHFINARAETYNLAKEWLKGGGSIPNHPDLIKEMASIEYKYNNNEQLQLESKADLKKRIGVSPDFCDAFTMLFFKRASEAQLNLKLLQRRN